MSEINVALMPIERVLMERFGWRLHFDPRPRVLPAKSGTGVHAWDCEKSIVAAQQYLKSERLKKLGLTIKQAQRRQHA